MFYLTLIFYIKYILYMCIRLLGHIQQYIIEHTNRQVYKKRGAYPKVHLIKKGGCCHPPLWVHQLLLTLIIQLLRLIRRLLPAGLLLH